MPTVKLVRDDPILVNEKMGINPYLIKDVKVIENFGKEVTKTKMVRAAWAREHGFKTDPEAGDEEEVEITWTENQSEPVKIFKRCIRFRRGKNLDTLVRSNRQTISRSELFDASIYPDKYIHNENLLSMIIDEIQYWMNNNIGNQPLDPLILVFLDIKDDQYHGHVTGVRKIFLIKQYSPERMLVEDANNQTHELFFGPNVIDSGIVRRFTLFLPSNAHIYDEGECVL